MSLKNTHCTFKANKPKNAQSIIIITLKLEFILIKKILKHCKHYINILNKSYYKVWVEYSWFRWPLQDRRHSNEK